MVKVQVGSENIHDCILDGSSFSIRAAAVANRTGKVLLLSSASDDAVYNLGYKMVCCE